MRKVLFIVLALAFVACASAAFAQDNPPPAPPAPPPGGMAGGGMRWAGMTCAAMVIAPPQAPMIERMADALALTDAKKKGLMAVLAKSEKALKDLRPKVDAATKALHDAILAPAFDAGKAALALADAQKLEASVATSELQTWTEIRAILTADQMAKLSDAMSRRIGGGMGGNRPGNRGRRNQPGETPPGPPPPAPAE